jgi:hypothetical protein
MISLSEFEKRGLTHKMKISIEHYGTIYTVETDNEDVTRSDALEMIYNLLQSVGYEMKDLIKENREQ